MNLDLQRGTFFIDYISRVDIKYLEFVQLPRAFQYQELLELNIQHFARSHFLICDLLNIDEEDHQTLHKFVKNDIIDEISASIYYTKGKLNDSENNDFVIEENDINLYHKSGTFSERHSRCFMMPVKKLKIIYKTQLKVEIQEVNLTIPNVNPKLEELQIKYNVGNNQKDIRQIVYIGADLAIVNLIRLQIQTIQQMPIFQTKDDFKFKRLRELVIMEQAQQTVTTDIIQFLIKRSFDTLETFEYIRSNDCLDNILKQEQANEYVKLLQFLNKKKLRNLAFLIEFEIQHHQNRLTELEMMEIYKEIGQFTNLRSLKILYESDGIEEFLSLSNECLSNLNYLRKLHIDFMLQRSDFEEVIYHVLTEMRISQLISSSQIRIIDHQILNLIVLMKTLKNGKH
eukprot:403354989